MQRKSTFVALAICSWLGGCATDPSTYLHPQIMGHPTITGLGQVRDSLTGQPVFMPCNPCAMPTTKTPLLPVEPVQQVVPNVGQQESILMRGNLVSTLTNGGDGGAPQPQSPSFVLFSNAGYRLDEDAIRAVKIMAKEAIDAQSVVVTGQTDNTGSHEGNRRLAWLRANALRDALVLAGVPKAKIKTEICLTCYPANNDSDAGRKQNRRAVVKFDSYLAR